MRRLLIVLALATLASSQILNAQTTDTKTWPECRLGAAPIAPGPAPTEATVFKTTGGPVVMSEAGKDGAVRFIRCRLVPGTEVYRSADGTLRDLPSNQPFWPVGWDGAPIKVKPLEAILSGKLELGPLEGHIKVDVGPVNVNVTGEITHKIERPADRYDGWCDIWTSTGCTVGAIFLAGLTAGGICQATTGSFVCKGHEGPKAITTPPTGGRPPQLGLTFNPRKGNRSFGIKFSTSF